MNWLENWIDGLVFVNDETEKTLVIDFGIGVIKKRPKVKPKKVGEIPVKNQKTSVIHVKV